LNGRELHVLIGPGFLWSDFRRSFMPKPAAARLRRILGSAGVTLGMACVTLLALEV